MAVPGVLEGCSAIVTGGATGLGREIAARLVASGATVIISDLDEEKGRTAVDQLGGDGDHVTYVRADVTKEEETSPISG